MACVALWRALEVEQGEVSPLSEPKFSHRLLTPLLASPYRDIKCDSLRLFFLFLLNIVSAPVSVGRAAGRVSSTGQRVVVTTVLALLFAIFIGLYILQVKIFCCF